jgi:iron-sulfur cluster assembly protein
MYMHDSEEGRKTMASALPIRISEAAAERVRDLLARTEKPVLGLRIGVRTRGCSGLSYTVEYAKEQKPSEQVIEDRGVRILIDPAAAMFLFGTEIDYEESALNSGFVFRNPNEKGRCGCGESFRV